MLEVFSHVWLEELWQWEEGAWMVLQPDWPKGARQVPFAFASGPGLPSPLQEGALGTDDECGGSGSIWKVRARRG